MQTAKKRKRARASTRAGPPSRIRGKADQQSKTERIGVRRDGNHNIKVGFAEPRSDGGSNAMLANIIEYGKSGQPAKPFLKPAQTSSRKACTSAMIRKLEEEVEKL